MSDTEGGFVASTDFLARMQAAVEHAQTLPEREPFLTIAFYEGGETDQWSADVSLGRHRRIATASSWNVWTVWAMVEAVVRQQIPVNDEGNE